MKSKPRDKMNSNRSAQNDGQSCDNQSDEGSQQDIEMESTSEPSFSCADGNLSGNHKCRIEIKLEDGNSTTQVSKPISSSFNKPGKQSVLDNEMATVDALFDGSWRSPVSSDLASVSDVISERRVSSESTDSEVLLDDAPSLDDVFDVLDAMDPFRPGQPMNEPLTTPSAHLMGDPSQLYRSNGVYQLPNAHVSSSWNPWNAFQSFNFGLVKGLQNPSRGLITAVRKLCELLSRPRSDHLDSVFVRLLNNLLKEMEDASQPQSKRPRKNSASRQAVFKRQRKWPTKSTSDAERSFERARIGLRHSFPSMSKSLPVISTRAGRCTEIVDLTGLEDCEKKNFEQQQDSKVEKERFIALEDTMSDFISSVSTLKSLSNASQTQSK